VDRYGSAGENDVGAVAQNVAPALIFGANHPFARVIATQKGLRDIQREDLRGFYQDGGNRIMPPPFLLGTSRWRTR